MRLVLVRPSGLADRVRDDRLDDRFRDGGLDTSLCGRARRLAAAPASARAAAGALALRRRVGIDLTCELLRHLAFGSRLVARSADLWDRRVAVLAPEALDRDVDARPALGLR